MEFSCVHRNSFCFICGHFVAARNIKKRSEKFLIWLRRYYGDEFEWIDEPYVPNVGCTGCYSSMQRCFENSEKKPKYKVPMKWYDPGQHDADSCYFCMNTKHRINTPKGTLTDYEASPYTELPKPHTDTTPPLNFGLGDQPIVDEEGPMDLELGDVDMNVGIEDVSEMAATTSSYVPRGADNTAIRLISQPRLNNICRRLELSQRKSHLLASMLKEDNLLAPDVKITQKKRQSEFIPFFTTRQKLQFCKDITGLMQKLKIEYDPTDWRLFIDASKSGLKAILLHNDGAYMPIPVAYSRQLKESYASMKLIFDSIKYKEHNWDVSADLKAVALILGLQLGRTKNACFICTWISTAKIKHYHATWEKRGEFEIGVMNITHRSCCSREKILLPTLHIKLGLVGSFVRKLDKDGEAFRYLGVLFPRLSLAKRKQGNKFISFSFSSM